MPIAGTVAARRAYWLSWCASTSWRRRRRSTWRWSLRCGRHRRPVPSSWRASASRSNCRSRATGSFAYLTCTKTRTRSTRRPKKDLVPPSTASSWRAPTASSKWYPKSESKLAGAKEKLVYKYSSFAFSYLKKNKEYKKLHRLRPIFSLW